MDADFERKIALGKFKKISQVKNPSLIGETVRFSRKKFINRVKRKRQRDDFSEEPPEEPKDVPRKPDKIINKIYRQNTTRSRRRSKRGFFSRMLSGNLSWRGKLPFTTPSKAVVVLGKQKFVHEANRSDFFPPRGTSIPERKARGETPDFHNQFFKQIEEENNKFLFG